MAARYELKKIASGKFLFNLKAANGQVILTSQAYEDKGGAMNGIESVRRNANSATNFDRKVATNGQPFFTLKAGNSEVIGKSELYSSASAMNNGIASVMRNAPEAIIADIS